MLYAGGNLDPIDLSSYIGDILDQSIISFGSLNERVRVTKQLEPISVDVDAAIPIGLIVTELLTNAFRYAFPSRRCGEVRIGLASRSGYGEVTVMDDRVVCRRSVTAVAFASCKRWYLKSTVISS